MSGKKNVLLITVDQWGGNYLGCAGNQEILTPSLDALARSGIRYTNAISCTPVCIPARRELMLGVEARRHGDRNFNESLPMPADIPTLAQTFSENGYQTYAVGKLHVFPQRNRIGFDDVILNEEGRHKEGMEQDDYERYLMHHGYAGLEMAHAMCNNNYSCRPFHLPEEMHPTNWATRQMCETIMRRDPTRPAFWYLSYIGPHPPLVPPEEYLRMYDDIELEAPRCGDWAKDEAKLPYAYRYAKNIYPEITKRTSDIARKAYYSVCTYIDHQLRLVIGTLREQGLLEDTMILFTSDHGDMMGSHNLYMKNVMYEDSVKVPFILSPAAGSDMPCGIVDDRLVELRDVMPTLLKMAGLEVPESVTGESLTEPSRREYVYGELYDNKRATRMIRTKTRKLIYYPVGNVFQLFDLEKDPGEMHDVADDFAYAGTLADLKTKLAGELYGPDLAFLKDGEFVGLPAVEYDYISSLKDPDMLFKGRDMLLQRGIR